MAVGQATPVRRIRAVITGRVQGVGYRAATAHAGTARGLVGWVANRADGAVVLEAQGPAAAVAALVTWCERGPTLAAVSSVEVEDRDVVDGEAGFAIRRPDLAP